MSIENNFEQEFDSRDARMDFKNVLKGILEKANAEERLPSDQEEDKDSSSEDLLKGSKIVSASPQKQSTPRGVKRRKRREDPRFERQKSRDDLNQDKEIHRKTGFFSEFQLTPEVFDLLLQKVSAKITKQRTQFRRPISAGERLAVTLRFLATGDAYSVIGSAYCMSKSVLCCIIPDTCAALWEVLQPEVLPKPNTSVWKNSFATFKTIFPHCVGALAGKYVAVNPSSHKESASNLVLQAVFDARGSFLAVDIGSFSNQSDESYFLNSEFSEMILDQEELPPPQRLTNGMEIQLPYVFLANEVFPLSPQLMRAFPGSNLTLEKRTFNSKLTEATQVADDTFDVMLTHFRILRRPITLTSENAVKVVKAVIILHNFFLRHRGKQYYDAKTDGHILNPGAFSSLPRQGRKHSLEAGFVRDAFTEYISNHFGEPSSYASDEDVHVGF